MIDAISPIDGRYASRTRDLSQYFSEAALIRYRIRVEQKYLSALLPYISDSLAEDALGNLPSDIWSTIKIDEDDIQRVKDIERITNHDVKAVEYLLKEKLDGAELVQLKEWVHFGLTSQDVNNTAFPLMVMEAWQDLIHPTLTELRDQLHSLAQDWEDVAMLARTHGQPASPTRLGKEIAVFVERIDVQMESLTQVAFTGKFGGATGNFNAHHVAFPDLDWQEFSDDFHASLGLQRQRTTTQIEHYDQLAAFLHGLSRIHVILIDLCRDIWTYVSMDYFKQKIKAGEVGSSTMPHKVNPIDFENAEGNLGMANAVASHLAEKLPISRLQRDLTDSTVLRNIGLPMAYGLIAYTSLKKGLNKLLLHEDALRRDLDAQWAVVTEGIQTIMRREQVPDAYEKLKDLSRVNDVIDAQSISAFIDKLDIDEKIKEEMRAITPHSYTGVKITPRP